MSNINSFIAGVGVSLLASAVLTKFFEIEWFLTSLGALCLIIAGTGIIKRK